MQQAIVAEGPLVLPQEKKLLLPKYCESVYQTIRRPTRTIHVRLTSVSCSGWAPMQCCMCLNAIANIFLSSVLLPQIGNVETGSEHPVRLQTMTTTGAKLHHAVGMC